MIAILCMKKLRLREVKQLDPSHRTEMIRLAYWPLEMSSRNHLNHTSVLRTILLKSVRGSGVNVQSVRQL